AVARARTLGAGEDVHALARHLVAVDAEIERRGRLPLGEAADVSALVGVVEPVPGRGIRVRQRRRERRAAEADEWRERSRARAEVVAQLVVVEAVLVRAVASALQVEVLVVAAEVLAVGVEIVELAALAQLEAEDRRRARGQVAVLVQLRRIVRVLADIARAKGDGAGPFALPFCLLGAGDRRNEEARDEDRQE